MIRSRRSAGAQAFCSVISLGLLLASPGCDKIRQFTKQETDAEVEEETPEVAIVTEPPPVEELPPPAPTGQEIVEQFLALPTYQRTDAQLQKLAEQTEGLERISDLNLTRSPVTDSGLHLLTAIPNLQTLNLSGTRISPAGLRVLQELKSLRSLILDEVRLDEQGLSEIGNANWLTALSLRSVPVSDASLEKLQPLADLRVLKLDGNPNLTGGQLGGLIKNGVFSKLKEFTAEGTKIGYYGLDSIASMKELEVFQGRQANVPDNALQGLGRCKNLRILGLSGNPVTDAGIRQLGQLKNLEVLDLRDCPTVTDNSLNTIKNLTSLTRLDLSRSSCSLDAAKKLKMEFLPTTTIVIDDQEL